MKHDRLVPLPDDPPMVVKIRCPNCGFDLDPRGPVDRHKMYECDQCTYEFSFAGKANLAERSPTPRPK